MGKSAGILVKVENAFQERGRDIFLMVLESLQLSEKSPIEPESLPDNLIRFSGLDSDVKQP
jgi:hypothetical protein